MIRSWPLLFIIIPLIELYVIIAVGEEIGAFWTVILVLLTAVIGVNLLRIQGMSTLMRAQRNMAQGAVPAMEMMEGIALAVAGVLLITPGFITDSIGFLCLIPASRRAIIRYIMARATVHTSFGGQSTQWQPGHQQQKPKPESPDTKRPKAGRTIEGEYRRED
ncbi:MAG: membrane protein FxsA [Gammaproteobacteria bacterium]|nr:MAG: membrane protein FxsA [Gammaproteobacteria bacterium]